MNQYCIEKISQELFKRHKLDHPELEAVLSALTSVHGKEVRVWYGINKDREQITGLQTKIENGLHFVMEAWHVRL